MAHWFFEIVLCYGLATQFHQTNCCGNSSFGISTPEETTINQRLFFPSGNLQGSKKMFIQKKISGSNSKQTLKRINANSLLNLTTDQNWLNKCFTQNLTIEQNNTKIPESNATTINKNVNNFKKGSNKNMPYKKLQTTETKYRRNILNAQVPDYDIENIGSTFSEETTSEHLDPPKSLKYFYRNNKKLLVKNHWEEGDDYYQINKQTDDGGGSGMNEPDDDDEDVDDDNNNNNNNHFKEFMENLLHREDALEKSNDKGPTFKYSMTWVNMRRANRGWFPKKRHN